MDVRVKCATCEKEFIRSRDRVREARRRHWRAYCSPECQFKPRKFGRMLHCGNPSCTKTFYRLRKEILKVQKSYCSRTCAVLVNNRNKPKRVRILHACANRSCGKDIPMYLKYCSRDCFRKHHTIYAPNELTKKLTIIASKLGRTPAKREARSIAEMCIRAFGTWNKSLIAAGLTPHRSHSERMYKRRNTIALDGHQCDSISEALVDNWLTKRKIRHERNASYPRTRHKADWSIGEKTFVEYFGLANDSPRYDRSIKEKRELCRKHKIRLIELYANDLYPENNLDAKLEELRAVV